MAVTTLDAKTALVVIDLQKGIVARPTAHPTEEVIKRASALADAFRSHGLPIVLVNVVGGAPGRTEEARNLGELPAGWADFVPELNQQPEDHVVTKRTWGAFTNTDLEQHLKKLGVTQVVIAGVLIASVGSGWVFLINAVSFVAVLCSLGFLRVGELHLKSRASRTRGNFAEGFHYVWKRPDLKAALLMIFLIGTFGLNFPIFISTMSVTVFHAGAGQYGILTSIMAIGSVVGALLAARRPKPHIALLVSGAAIFGFGCLLAAIMPNYGLFGIALIIIGVSTQTFTTSTISLVQLSTEPAMRGRVVAILFAIALGGTPVGAPIVGWVADRFGPRWALGVGAASGFAAAIVGIYYLRKYRHLRIRINAGRLRFSIDDGDPMTDSH